MDASQRQLRTQPTPDDRHANHGGKRGWALAEGHAGAPGAPRVAAGGRTGTLQLAATLAPAPVPAGGNTGTLQLAATPAPCSRGEGRRRTGGGRARSAAVRATDKMRTCSVPRVHRVAQRASASTQSPCMMGGNTTSTTAAPGIFHGCAAAPTEQPCTPEPLTTKGFDQKQAAVGP